RPAEGADGLLAQGVRRQSRLEDDLDALGGIFALAVPGTHVHVEALSTLALRIVNDWYVDRPGLLARSESLDSCAEIHVVPVRNRGAVARPPDHARARVECSTAPNGDRGAWCGVRNNHDGLLGLERLGLDGLSGNRRLLHLGRLRRTRV